jgi:hypothetical protein
MRSYWRYRCSGSRIGCHLLLVSVLLVFLGVPACVPLERFMLAWRVDPILRSLALLGLVDRSWLQVQEFSLLRE